MTPAVCCWSLEFGFHLLPSFPVTLSWSKFGQRRWTGWMRELFTARMYHTSTCFLSVSWIGLRANEDTLTINNLWHQKFIFCGWTLASGDGGPHSARWPLCRSKQAALHLLGVDVQSWRRTSVCSPRWHNSNPTSPQRNTTRTFLHRLNFQNKSKDTVH